MSIQTVIHVIASLDPAYGGPSRVVESLAIEQSKLYKHVLIITTYLSKNELNYINDIRERIKDNHPNVSILAYQSITFYRFNLRLLVSLYTLRLNSIFHFHGLYRFPTSLGPLFCRIFKIRYVIRPHGSLDPWLFKRSSNNYLYYLFKKLSEITLDFSNLSHAYFVHFTTHAEMLKARKILPFTFASKIVPNGLQVLRQKTTTPFVIREFHSIPFDSRIILYIGRIHSKKGINILIESFIRVSQEFSDVYLLICGPVSDNSDKNNLKLIESLPLSVSSRIIYYNKLIPPEKVWAYFDQSNLFVLPSHSENFGLTVIEALSHACPVLISKNVDLFENLVGTGFVGECSMNPDKLSDQISHELSSQILSSTASSKAPAFIKNNYSWLAIARQLDNYYKES